MAPLTPDQEQALERLRRQQMAEARRIRRVVAHECSLTVARLCARDRVAPVNQARQLCMYLMRTDLCWPMPERDSPFSAQRIADLLGHRDHSTILHGIEAISHRVTTDRALAHLVTDIRAELQHDERGEHHDTGTHRSSCSNRALAGQHAPVRPQGQRGQSVARRTGRVHSGAGLAAAAQGAA